MGYGVSRCHEPRRAIEQGHRRACSPPTPSNRHDGQRCRTGRGEPPGGPIGQDRPRRAAATSRTRCARGARRASGTRRSRRSWRSRRAVPAAVLGHARPGRPRGRVQRHVRPPGRLSPACRRVGAVGLPGAGHGDLPVGRASVPHRRHRRDPLAHAGHDAADRPGDHSRVHRVLGCQPGPARRRAELLVGARAAGRDHAAGSLDRDALTGPDHLGAGLPGGAAARRGRAGRSRRCRRHRLTGRPGGRRRGHRPARLVGARRRNDRGRGGEHGRVHGDRGVPYGAAPDWRSGRGRHRCDRLGPAGRGHGDRGRYRAGRDPPARGRRPGIVVAGSASGRHRGRVVVLVRPRRSSAHRGGLVSGRVARHRRGAHHHRARHRLPACSRAGHPAGGLHLHRARRPWRRAGEGSSGVGVDAHRRCRAVRQDRDPHQGEPTVIDIEPGEGRAVDEVLALAAAAESDSEHPLARAIVGAASNRGLTVPPAREFSSSPAVGVEATVDGTRIQVGGPHLLDQHGAAEFAVADQWRRQGAIILHVLADGKVIAALRLADEIRPESREAVEALHAVGTQVVMITGDARAVAETVAADLGIDRVFAGVRPEDKAAKVAELQSEGRRVAMVGDGVNDAPALAQADVGIAIGAGTDVAIGSAGVILASSDPRSVLSVIDLSRASYRKMKQNLWWAAGYNLASVPLAAGVLAPVGFVLPMSVGAILMSASTVVVALNAQLLRRLDLTPARSTARLAGADTTG
ncbi:hypothetical protein L7F22_010005 [Adiantum nelumboides]|nr:hypothetical protein [Adiantum nelumboides]